MTILSIFCDQNLLPRLFIEPVTTFSATNSSFVQKEGIKYFTADTDTLLEYGNMMIT